MGPGVYVIDCNKCSFSYVGETGRYLETRKTEHERDVSKYNVNSAIAKHCWSERDHRMDFEISRIVYKSNNVKVRRLIEGALINRTPTIEGNESFSKVDSIHLKTIVKEAGLTNLVRQKRELINDNRPQRIIPQNDRPSIPGFEPLPLEEERILGSRLVSVNGQCIRRSHRLNLT